jgi:hypothetical protein
VSYAVTFKDEVGAAWTVIVPEVDLGTLEPAAAQRFDARELGIGVDGERRVGLVFDGVRRIGEFTWTESEQRRAA